MSINVGKILIFGSTHGHERIGLRVIEELKKLSIDSSMVEFVVGNPEASKKNVPFIETDLNRAFPGKEHGTYEEMRAFELSAKIIKADLVIDIHSTNTTDLSDESALIVTSYNQLTKNIISTVNPPKVLHMKYKSDNALISQAKIGIAFEYGKDSSTSVLNAILYDIAQILIYYNILVSNPYSSTKKKVKTRIFEVYDVYKKDFTGPYILMPEIRNFHKVKKDSVICKFDFDRVIVADNNFIPILFGENRYTDILGFKANEIT